MEQLLSHSSIKKIEIQASYLQIYCETITDLLYQSDSVNGVPPHLSIRENGANNVYVEGLSRTKISSLEDLWFVLQQGDNNRSTATTNMNETSSRSHAALLLTIVSREDGQDMGEETSLPVRASHDRDDGGVLYRESTLVLVDLAGSERAAASDGES